MINNLNRTFKKMMNKKLIKWVAIPFVLLMLWISLSLMFSSYRSFSVLEFAHNKEIFVDLKSERLYRGNKLSGEFIAKEDNLGIAAVRIRNVPKVEFEDGDVLVFKIKEKGKIHWISENHYSASALVSNQYFPFGFEVQEESKGKIYQFELISLKGNAHNAVFIDVENQNFISKYKLTKGEIFTSIESIFIFGRLKLLSFITNNDALMNSLFFILPLVLYVISIVLPIEKLIKKKELMSFKRMVALLVTGLIFLDILYSEVVIAGFVLGILGLWVLAVIINKFTSKASYILSSALILFSLITIYFKVELSIDKITTFAYLLLTIAVVHTLLEFRSNFK